MHMEIVAVGHGAAVARDGHIPDGRREPEALRSAGAAGRAPPLDVATGATTFAVLMTAIQGLNRESLYPLHEMSIYIDFGDYRPSPLCIDALRHSGRANDPGSLEHGPALKTPSATFAFLTQLILPVGRSRDVNELVAFLACCPALQTLSIIVEFNPAVTQPAPRLRARLPCFESLLLSDVRHMPYSARHFTEEDWGAIWLLNFLELPALRSLSLEFCIVYAPSTAAHLDVSLLPSPETLAGFRHDALRFMDTTWDSVRTMVIGLNDFICRASAHDSTTCRI
ncbi:hypothetical protein EWM64_g2634 [Hericium alpestre]|uniref:Uncharacterized protein n=1 Tax=Hericium alpestre TaxID=135208 RepID=A0A4Z0A4J5_9AGAM|nr:hypothetical protein EWM64_g2634 [Hericium alpestre]